MVHVKTFTLGGPGTNLEKKIADWVKNLAEDPDTPYYFGLVQASASEFVGIMDDNNARLVSSIVTAIRAIPGVAGLKGDKGDQGEPGPVGVPVFVMKPAAQSVVSSAVLINDLHLLFPVVANHGWAFEFYVVFEAATAADLKFSVTGPAGATAVWSTHPQQVAGGGFDQSTVFGLGGVDLMAGAGAGIKNAVLIKGLVINGGTPGVVQLQWAQNTANVTTTIVHPKSFVLAHLVN